MSRARTLSLGDTTSREPAAPLSARHGSYRASCVHPYLQLHRHGGRSACVRLRRVEAWHARSERSGGTVFNDGDGDAIKGFDGLVAGNENAKEIGCDLSSHKSSQSGPSTHCIQDTCCVF